MTLELSITAVCQSNYIGAACEEFADCYGVTCSGRGICTDADGAYNCNCDEGYIGRDCEISESDCRLEFCNGRGECMEDFSCKCDTGFAGNICQVNIDDCVNSRNCSGNGQCTDGVNDYSCDCDSGYSGRDCEVKLDQLCVGSDCGDNGQYACLMMVFLL